MSKKTDWVKLTFEYQKSTQRKDVYTQALPFHENLVHDAELPTIYIDKTVVAKQLGDAAVLEVWVRGVVLEMEPENAD